MFVTGLLTLTALLGLTLAAPAVINGKVTYYHAGLGACGQTHSGSDFVVALNKIIFDPQTPGGNPNNNALCNRRIRVRDPGNGRLIDVTVAGRCEICSANDLDLSQGAFEALGHHVDQGVSYADWQWL